jgi:hypothetical protein
MIHSNYWKEVFNIQGISEMRAEILTTSYWLHVELGKKLKKFIVKKIK